MHRATAARMLVDATAFMTPVGPFCPFRSDACALNGNMDSSMNSLTSKSASFMADMARFQLEAQMGSMPDPERVRNVANGLSEAHAEWETLMQRMRLSGDFQSREYFKMTQAHLKTQGQSLEAIGMAMRWQVDTMKAFADGRPPPNPPVGLDMEAMAKQAQQGSGGGMASALGGPPTIDAPPFDQGAAFDSPVVKEEYEKLCRDHDGLIRMGASYGSFDPLGKVAFLDALEAVEARWDTFFARFALMGVSSIMQFPAQPVPAHVLLHSVVHLLHRLRARARRSTPTSSSSATPSSAAWASRRPSSGSCSGARTRRCARTPRRRGCRPRSTVP